MSGQVASITYEYGGNLYINMTNRCPNRCAFCLRTNSTGSLYAENLWYQNGEPSKEEILADLQMRNLNAYHEVVFCGYGEPACRWDDMMWLCDEIRKLGAHFIRINTNGQADLIVGRDTAAELDGRVDALSVSLNAATPEAYQEICHSDFGIDALPAILRFTAAAVLRVPHVRMTVVSTMDPEEQSACKALCASIGADFEVREYISQ